MKKRIIALIAVLALSLCMLPASVFASDLAAGVFVQGNATVAGETVVVSIGDANYSLFASFDNYDVSGVADKPYTGAEIQQALQVTPRYMPEPVLVEGQHYEVSYADNVNVGTATITITALPPFNGVITKAFNVTKANNALVKVVKSKKIAYGKLKKKKQSFKIGALFKQATKVTYKATSIPKKAKKYIKVASSGKVTVKKGLKKGTYKLKVMISAAQTANYKAWTGVKKITVKVK